jgi:hypothetical protein
MFVVIVQHENVIRDLRREHNEYRAQQENNYEALRRSANNDAAQVE